MVKRSKGIMANTRSKFKKSPRNRGSPPITRFLHSYDIGEKANIVIESSSQRGQPHHRYHGRVGTIIGMQGKSYIVRIKLDRINKDLIVRAEHLRPIRE